jgi:hypothetical protein
LHYSNLNKNILNRKLIRLTGVGETLTKEAEVKVKYMEAEGEDYELNDEDFTDVEQEMAIFVDEIVSFVRAEEKETVIFTKTGLNFTVKETIEEIENKLNN